MQEVYCFSRAIWPTADRRSPTEPGPVQPVMYKPSASIKGVFLEIVQKFCAPRFVYVVTHEPSGVHAREEIQTHHHREAELKGEYVYNVECASEESDHRRGG